MSDGLAATDADNSKWRRMARFIGDLTILVRQSRFGRGVDERPAPLVAAGIQP
ncbi:MAG: hypothetical protein MJE12_23385 [Alphaproteobacteria bacterium]|nr:hypothetical protein [Alphaproteobacteria bacterium]